MAGLLLHGIAKVDRHLGQLTRRRNCGDNRHLQPVPSLMKTVQPPIHPTHLLLPPHDDWGLRPVTFLKVASFELLTYGGVVFPFWPICHSYPLPSCFIIPWATNPRSLVMMNVVVQISYTGANELRPGFPRRLFWCHKHDSSLLPPPTVSQLAQCMGFP